MQMRRRVVGATAILLFVQLGTATVVHASSNRPPQISTTLDVGPVAVTVDPVTATLPDGSTETVYELPDGGLITAVTPPVGFNPLTSDDETLSRYGFPLPPADEADYEAWFAAMAAFRSDDPPTEPLRVTTGTPADRWSFSTVVGDWGGFVAGTEGIQAHTYVAVKGNFTVPTNIGTCAASNQVAFWIGLGGTTHPNDLVQQGIECGNTSVGTGSGYRPFTEFANSYMPIPFCGQSSWTVGAGHIIYQNMSFQTSTNKAFFYLEDQTAGVAHSCSATPGALWAWDLNTAEWVAEGGANIAVDFGSVHFYNTRTELYSNSTWVTLGSQPYTRHIEGVSLTNYCVNPGSLGSDLASFTATWANGSCR